jgi:hypothetical protein
MIGAEALREDQIRRDVEATFVGLSQRLVAILGKSTRFERTKKSFEHQQVCCALAAPGCVFRRC